MMQSLLYLFLLFIAASQVLGEELFGGCEELEAVRGFGETVSFVGEQHVFVGGAFVLHGCGVLFGFGLFHAGVVRALPDQQGNFDLVDFEKRRARFQELCFGGGIANALVEDGDGWLPVLRDALNQGDEVAGTDDVYGAAEEVGGESCADQGGIAATGTADNGY